VRGWGGELRGWGGGGVGRGGGSWGGGGWGGVWWGGVGGVVGVVVEEAQERHAPLAATVRVQAASNRGVLPTGVSHRVRHALPAQFARAIRVPMASARELPLKMRHVQLVLIVLA
jgi:hypothetical protein